MSSIRDARTWLMGIVAVSGLVGCQGNVPPARERIDASPLIVDEAMQRREWDRQTSFYANGDTVDGGNGYMFRTHETIPPAARTVVEPAVTTTNMVLLPIGVFVNSPFARKVDEGAVIPPTQSAMPVLPR